jgi:radical SAM superfamily enzyme YgiQ (UPF0313 family)
MKTTLVGLNPSGIVGMAPYYLKSYYAGRMDAEDARNINIVGYDVAADLQRPIREILAAPPEVLGFSCYVWNMEEILAVCEAIRPELPATRIVLGGPEASPRAVELMRKHDAIDAVVVGEGEQTFAALMAAYRGGEKDLGHIEGLVYRHGSQVQVNKPRGVIQDLGEVPSPFLTGIVDFDKLGGYLFGYETYRGCPFTCSFCYWGRMLSVRYFPLERMQQELAIILKSGLRRMWLGDAVANLHKKRFKEFLRTVIALDTSTIIDFEMVADILDEETIDLLGHLNDGYIAFGLQSINDRALATITRKWKRPLFTRNVRRLRERTDKIKIYIDLIYGLPEDSPQTYEDGIRYAMSLLPHKIQPHPLLMLPGAPLFDNPETYGIVYDEKAPHYVLENKWWSRADMQEAAKWTDKLFFYFNPAVNTTIIMVSQILEQDPFSVFNRLYEFISERFDPTLVGTDIGLRREVALELNHLLELFIVATLTDPKHAAYLPLLIDVMAFAGCKTMFYASRSANGGVAPPWLNANVSFPTLSQHVVVKRFRHDVSALYKNNILRSPDELLRLEARTYDVVFNLQTHSIYHVSEHISDLLAACSGTASLNQLVNDLARHRRLAVDDDARAAIQATFGDLARRQVVDFGYGLTV